MHTIGSHGKEGKNFCLWGTLQHSFQLKVGEQGLWKEIIDNLLNI
jgi:hypothetical protein